MKLINANTRTQSIEGGQRVQSLTLGQGRQSINLIAEGPYTSGPYDKIENISPDLFAQFRYPVYNNTQVLFRDPACTLPVTDAGVHTIGGVKDPFTGAIILTQPDAAKRLMWMGEVLGAKGDGVDDYLYGDNPLESSSRTIIIGAKSPANLSSVLAATSNASNNGFYIRALAERDVRIRQQGPVITSLSLSSYQESEPFVVSFRFDTTDGHWGRIRGIPANTNIATDEGTDSPNFFVGARGWGTNTKDHFDGYITEVAAWIRVLSIPEISTVEGVLA